MCVNVLACQVESMHVSVFLIQDTSPSKETVLHVTRFDKGHWYANLKLEILLINYFDKSMCFQTVYRSNESNDRNVGFRWNH